MGVRKKRYMASDSLLPVFMDVKGRHCLIIGGGPMAAAKAADLLECGARVHLVSPSVVPELAELAVSGRLRWSRRRAEASDIAESYIIFGSDEKVGAETPVSYRDLEEYRQWADSSARLYNAIDHRELSHFTNPSVARKLPLVLALSTGGTAPVLGRYLKDRIMTEILTDEFVAFARFLGKYRKRLRSLIPDYLGRRDFYQSLIDTNFVAFLRDRDEEEALSELIRRVADKRKESNSEEARPPLRAAAD